MKIKPIPFTPNSKVNPLLNETFFTYGLNKAAIKAKELFNDAIAKYKISGIEFVIMYVLETKTELSQKDLGSEMNIDKASMEKFLDRLQKENYIKRTEDQADRRIKFISLTPKGRSVVQKMKVVSEAVEQDFLGQKLTSNEQKTLKTLIRKLMA